jgi:hypothetical protein
MIIIIRFLLVGGGGAEIFSGATPFSYSREGSATSSSSTFLQLTSFERNPFSRNDPFLATQILPLDL